METQSVMNYVQEKLKELQEKRSQMGTEGLMNYVVEKSMDFLPMLESSGGYFLGWLDNVFPPETRGEKVKPWLHVAAPFIIKVKHWKHWLHVAAPFIIKVKHWLHVAAPFTITGVTLLVCICCCLRCCGRGGRVVKMMKAPGRNYRMPRPPFENNPRSYFRNLRGKP